MVRPNPDNTYSLEVAAKDSVPLFGPRVSRRKYPRSQAFVELVLAKVINGQNAAYRAPAFLEKLRRTREFLINDIMSKFMNSGPMASPRKLSSMDSPDKKAKDKMRTFTKKSTLEFTSECFFQSPFQEKQ